MPFYIRKSVRVGPLRFNLSKSGIGVSAGIKGFRVGTGPRGNYVRMGRGGLYYRQTLSSPASHETLDDTPRDVAEEHVSTTHGPMQTITSGCVSRMVDSSSTQILSELEEKKQRMLWWPVVAVVSVLFVFGLVAVGVDHWITVPLGVFSLVGTVYACMHDTLAKSVVIMYDLDDSSRHAFQNVYDSVLQFARCGATWHVGAQGRVYDPKYHAGAGQLINRKRISVDVHDPPYVKTNVATVRIPLGRKSLSEIIHEVGFVGRYEIKDRGLVAVSLG